jgi:EAL domain-containing protein (putative c-di-GMP-specific phosphodiesterase class I)
VRRPELLAAVDAALAASGLSPIVELAEALELTVVAEGIEGASQVALLRRLGCRVGQGFHLAGH